MLDKLRPRSAYDVMAAVSLFIVLGGTSYAVATGSIDSREIKNNTIAGKDIRNNQISTRDVKNASLLAADFKARQLPRGRRGAQGPKGDSGTVDTSNLYTKTESDGRFLVVGAKAADADTLDGKDSAAFSQILRSGTKTTTFFPIDPGTCIFDNADATNIPVGKLVIPFAASFPFPDLIALPGYTDLFGPPSNAFSARWKVCNVGNVTRSPGTVTTRYVILGP